MEKNDLIPVNDRGKQLNLQASTTLRTKEAAAARFKLAAARLLRPQRWQQLCGAASASFEVMGKKLKPLMRRVEEDDYIRINIPGPGPGLGDGYDWVRVSLIESSGVSDHRQLGLKLAAIPNPHSAEPSSAHFFKSGSSSTLIVHLDNMKVMATYHGRNEVVNNETGNVPDNIRNTIIAAGAMAGLSELQWSRLIHALIEEEEK